MNSEISCTKVYVKKIKDKGLGAFSNCDIRKGELIEKGIIIRVNIDGNYCEHLFTWSEDREIWGFGSGCSTFYNTSRDPNTEMLRFYDENRFEIYSTRNIKRNEELTHKYKSLEWRKCFENLKRMKDL